MKVKNRIRIRKNCLDPQHIPALNENEKLNVKLNKILEAKLSKKGEITLVFFASKRKEKLEAKLNEKISKKSTRLLRYASN
jgi:hypothetical protein